MPGSQGTTLDDTHGILDRAVPRSNLGAVMVTTNDPVLSVPYADTVDYCGLVQESIGLDVVDVPWVFHMSFLSFPQT
jgi:hypothetical protein